MFANITSQVSPARFPDQTLITHDYQSLNSDAESMYDSSDERSGTEPPENEMINSSLTSFIQKSQKRINMWENKAIPSFDYMSAKRHVSQEL